MLDYKCLEALDAVVREGGFEKAARVLHITQSAVSQRVKSLEGNAGRVLLMRGSPPRLTDAGERMVKHCRQVASLEQGLAAELEPEKVQPYVSLPVGVNADSLATWFLEAVHDFLFREKILLDIACDDQDATHELLRRGKVLGCVSSRPEPMQGCDCVLLGRMDYMFATSPEYIERFLPNGPAKEALRTAPMIFFNRRDELQTRFLAPLFKSEPVELNVHYIPSSEQFVSFIRNGHAAGMVPVMQIKDDLKAGRLTTPFPDRLVPVPLYWHCWSIRSATLRGLTDALITGAARLFPA